MTTLSAAVIAKDEERNIRRCLQSLRFADEIVVVDSGSRDRTVELARELTPHVHFQEWLGFGPQKNRAIELTTGEWVLVLDADEWVPEELAREIRETIGLPDAADLYEILRRTLFLGRPMTHCWSGDWTARLFRRDAARHDGRAVHERLTPRAGARLARLKSAYLHDTYRDLSHYVDKMNRYSDLFAEDPGTDSQWNPGRLVFSPLWAFVKMYVLKRGFLDGAEGFVLSVGTGYYHFMKYAKKRQRLAVRAGSAGRP